MKLILAVTAFLFLFNPTNPFSQPTTTEPLVASKDQIKFYTSEWEGERMPDGRPDVSEALLGPLTIGMFVALALGVRGTDTLFKSFSFSIWIFAAVSLAIQYH